MVQKVGSMANMGYCRFENTHSDFEDCFEKLGEINSLDELSDSEKDYAEQLIARAVDMAQDFGYMINVEVEVNQL